MNRATLTRLRAQDRQELEALRVVLNGARNALRRDECGDWAITGSRGTIRAVGGGFMVYIGCRSALHWTHARKQLAAFAQVRQDGHDEGVLALTRMPTPEEAATLRYYIGLRQTVFVPSDRAQTFAQPAGKGTYGENIDVKRTG
jgi:hypothetical protein